MPGGDKDYILNIKKNHSLWGLQILVLPKLGKLYFQFDKFLFFLRKIIARILDPDFIVHFGIHSKRHLETLY